MLNKGIDTVASVLENVVNKVEQIDESAADRDVIFGEQKQQKKPDADRPDPAQSSAQQVALQGQDAPLQKLKVVSGELLDLWLHEGFKGLEYLKQSKAYTLTDPYVDYVKQYERVKSSS